jgi:hypothetical protein
LQANGRARTSRQASQESREIGMPAELAFVHAYCADLALEDRTDIDAWSA